MDNTENSDTRPYILVSGFFKGQGQYKKLRYFERLDEALRPLGYQVLMLEKAMAAPATTCRAITLPASMQPKRIVGSNFLSRDDLTPELLYAAVMEAEARDKPFVEEGVRCIEFYYYVLEVFRKYKPALCILWHQFNGLHEVFVHACKKFGVPYLFVEYGSLPGTIAFDADGQMAESRVTREARTFLQLPCSPADMECARSFIEYVRKQKMTRKPQNSPLDVRPIVERAHAQDRKIIFYAGQQDWASGLLPMSWERARVHSPFYTDTIDALDHLSSIAHENNYQILFKPHPLVEDRHKEYRIAHPERVDLVLGANIFQCIELADVCTTILSQAAYIFLIHNKPCVLLGKNHIRYKGCVWEPLKKDDMGTVFESSIAQGFTQSQQEEFVKHVAQMCNYYLFSFEEEAEAIIGRTVELAASRIASYADNPCQPEGFPFLDDLPSTTPRQKAKQQTRKQVKQQADVRKKQVDEWVAYHLERWVSRLPESVYLLLKRIYGYIKK